MESDLPMHQARLLNQQSKSCQACSRVGMTTADERLARTQQTPKGGNTGWQPRRSSQSMLLWPKLWQVSQMFLSMRGIRPGLPGKN